MQINQFTNNYYTDKHAHSKINHHNKQRLWLFLGLNIVAEILISFSQSCSPYPVHKFFHALTSDYKMHLNSFKLPLLLNVLNFLWKSNH